MYPSKHILLGGIFSIICFFSFPQINLIEASIIFFSSFLIDIDHYLYYVWRKNDLNLKNSYNWFLKNEKIFLSLSKKDKKTVYQGFYFLHGFESLIILFLLGFLHKYFFFILIGFSFHLLLDYINIIFKWNKFEKFSIIYDYFKFKKKKFIEDIDNYI